MGLMRFSKKDLWKDYSASAGETTETIDVSKVEFTGIYLKVSGATDISLLVETTQGYIEFDKISFSAAGEDFWVIWAFPFENIKLKTSAAVTITIQIFIKT